LLRSDLSGQSFTTQHLFDIRNDPEGIYSTEPLFQTPYVQAAGYGYVPPNPPQAQSPISSHDMKGATSCSPDHNCTCISCLHLASHPIDTTRLSDGQVSVICKLPGCNHVEGRVRTSLLYANSGTTILDGYYEDFFHYRNDIDMINHERNHFKRAGIYRCLEPGCGKTTKKFADLKRHYRVAHCTNAIKYPCPTLGCKYSGNNGFLREDKLKSHYRNVHKEKAAPSKSLQDIYPEKDSAQAGNLMTVKDA